MYVLLCVIHSLFPFSRVNEPREGADEPRDRHGFLERLLDEALGSRARCPSTLANDWIVNLVANAEDVGTTVASSIMKGSFSEVVQCGDWSIDLGDRISAAGQLLCTALYVKHVADSPLGIQSFSALTAASEKLSSDVFPCADRSHHLYNEVLDARNTAVNDLNEALNLFKAELELANLKQSMAPQ
jgi:hypothetical protein